MPVQLQGESLGTPVVPFCPFYIGVSLLKLNSRKKGALITQGLLGNLGVVILIFAFFRVGDGLWGGMRNEQS